MKRIFVFIFSMITFSAFSQEKPEGLFINSRAPEFKAKDQSGIEINLKELRKKGPVVVLFYMGGWSPYCTRELARFQDSLQFFADKRLL